MLILLILLPMVLSLILYLLLGKAKLERVALLTRLLDMPDTAGSKHKLLTSSRRWLGSISDMQTSRSMHFHAKPGHWLSLVPKRAQFP